MSSLAAGPESLGILCKGCFEGAVSDRTTKSERKANLLIETNDRRGENTVWQQ